MTWCQTEAPFIRSKAYIEKLIAFLWLKMTDKKTKWHMQGDAVKTNWEKQPFTQWVHMRCYRCARDPTYLSLVILLQRLMGNNRHPVETLWVQVKTGNTSRFLIFNVVRNHCWSSNEYKPVAKFNHRHVYQNMNFLLQKYLTFETVKQCWYASIHSWFDMFCKIQNSRWKSCNLHYKLLQYHLITAN